jgi:hypothetical protein
VTGAPLLVRMDAANDAEETMHILADEATAFVLRWNPRGRDARDAWHALGDDMVHFASRPGEFTALSDRRHTLSDGRSVRRLTQCRCRRCGERVHLSRGGKLHLL